MRILVATDAWLPQVNGVVTTLVNTARELERLGHTVRLVTHEGLRTLPCPSYPEIRLAICTQRSVRRAIDDFPRPDLALLFLAEATQYGPFFGQLREEMQGTEMRAILGRKLGVDLTGRPTLATLHSCCQAKDGRIHPDSKFKLATILLCLNEPWAARSGRLRILRSPTKYYAAEVLPEGGLMVGFKVQKARPPAVHRSTALFDDQLLPGSGPTRQRGGRHRMTGRVKKFKRLIGLGRIARDQPAEIT